MRPDNDQYFMSICGIRRVVYGQDYRNGDDVVKMLRYASVDMVKREFAPEPILHIYQDSDEYFAALPSFVDRQRSSVAWLDRASAKRIKFILEHVGSETDTALYFSGDERHPTAQLTDEQKTARFEQAIADGKEVIGKRKIWVVEEKPTK